MKFVEMVFGWKVVFEEEVLFIASVIHTWTLAMKYVK